MLALSAAGGAASGISSIIQGAQARRAARKNYGRQREALAQTYQAGQDEIDKFSRQGQDFLGSQQVAAASSGLKAGGGTMDLIQGESRSALRRDVENLRTQNELNYSTGLEQASMDMTAAGQQATGAILGGIGGLASTAANVYSQGVNMGKWSPLGSKKAAKPTVSQTSRWKDPYGGYRWQGMGGP